MEAEPAAVAAWVVWMLAGPSNSIGQTGRSARAVVWTGEQARQQAELQPMAASIGTAKKSTSSRPPLNSRSPTVEDGHSCRMRCIGRLLDLLCPVPGKDLVHDKHEEPIRREAQNPQHHDANQHLVHSEHQMRFLTHLSEADARACHFGSH